MIGPSASAWMCYALLLIFSLLSLLLLLLMTQLRWRIRRDPFDESGDLVRDRARHKTKTVVDQITAQQVHRTNVPERRVTFAAIIFRT